MRACGRIIFRRIRDGSVDLVFNQLQQTSVDRGQFQGGVELVANFAEAFGVIALGDNGKGLADHKGNNGNGDQQCQFVRNLQ